MDEDLDCAWSDLHVGMRVRWITPTFVRRGTIVRIKGKGMEVQFDGLDRRTQIPDAAYYYANGKTGNAEEHLMAITGSAPKASKIKVDGIKRGDAITPKEAANILGVDVKGLRRMIRSGKVPAEREGGRWVLSRLKVQAVKR